MITAVDLQCTRESYMITAVHLLHLGNITFVFESFFQVLIYSFSSLRTMWALELMINHNFI